MSFRTGFPRILGGEFRRLFTSRDLLLMCFAAPFLYGIMLSSVYMYHRVNEVPTGMVDLDNSALSRRVARLADAAPGVDITRRFESTEHANEALWRGEVSSFIVIPEGFSAAVTRGEDAWSVLAIDSSNFLTANPVMQALTDICASLSTEVLDDLLLKKGLGREKAARIAQPLELDARPLFNPPLDYADYPVKAGFA